MSRPDRSQPISDIDDTRKCNAGAVIAQAERALKDRERQLAQLRRYLDEYLRRNTPALAIADSVSLENYRAFLARFAEAVRAQEQLVEQANLEYERKKDDWRVQHVEAVAFGSAVERMQLHEHTDEDAANRPKGDQ